MNLDFVYSYTQNTIKQKLWHYGNVFRFYIWPETTHPFLRSKSWPRLDLTPWEREKNLKKVLGYLFCGESFSFFSLFFLPHSPLLPRFPSTFAPTVTLPLTCIPTYVRKATENIASSIAATLLYGIGPMIKSYHWRGKSKLFFSEYWKALSCIFSGWMEHRGTEVLIYVFYYIITPAFLHSFYFMFDHQASSTFLAFNGTDQSVLFRKRGLVVVWGG